MSTQSGTSCFSQNGKQNIQKPLSCRFYIPQASFQIFLQNLITPFYFLLYSPQVYSPIIDFVASSPHGVPSPTDDPFHISKSMGCNFKIHRDQQTILITSQILKPGPVSVYHVYTVCIFIDFYYIHIYILYQQNLEVQGKLCILSSHFITIPSPFLPSLPSCTCKATSVAGLPGFKVA